MEFLEHATEELKVTLSSLITMKTFISICRKMSSSPLTPTENELINKYLNSIHNKNPVCKVKAPLSWDVNLLLKYFENLPSNEDLTLQELGGKLVLLFLICSGCHFGEIYQLRLSCIESPLDGKTVVFHLLEPTKTFTWKRLKQIGLQKLTFKTIPGFSKICPVQTLVDFLQKSRQFRKGEDRLWIISSGQPAARFTITRWAKNHLKCAGLGDLKLHDTRSMMSTGCLVLGKMELSRIAEMVGWTLMSTFSETT